MHLQLFHDGAVETRKTREKEKGGKVERSLRRRRSNKVAKTGVLKE